MAKEEIERLRGSRILLVEDEPLLLMALADELERVGAIIVGPAGSLDRALEVAGAIQIDGAILDISLHAESIFPLADLLANRNIPFIFASAQDCSQVPSRFLNAPFCPKPALPMEVIATLARLFVSRG